MARFNCRMVICDIDHDFVITVKVAGVSRYALDVKESHYNAVL